MVERGSTRRRRSSVPFATSAVVLPSKLVGYSSTMWFKSTAALGDFEQLVLLGVLRLGDAPTARPSGRKSTRARAATSRSTRSTPRSIGSRAKGCCDRGSASRRPQRGGRRRKFYALRPAGVAALRQAYRAFTAMADGLEAPAGDEMRRVRRARRLAADAAAVRRVARLRPRRSRGRVRRARAASPPAARRWFWRQTHPLPRGAAAACRRSSPTSPHIPEETPCVRTLAADVRYALRVLRPRAVVRARGRRRARARHRRQHRDLQHRQRRAAAAAAVRRAGSAGAAVPRAAAERRFPGMHALLGVAGQLLRLAARRRSRSSGMALYRFRQFTLTGGGNAEAVVAGAVGAGLLRGRRARSRRSGACSCRRKTRPARRTSSSSATGSGRATSAARPTRSAAR